MHGAAYYAQAEGSLRKRGTALSMMVFRTEKGRLLNAAAPSCGCLPLNEASPLVLGAPSASECDQLLSWGRGQLAGLGCHKRDGLHMSRDGYVL